MTDGSALAIFAKYPRLGSVKTRLEPALGAPGCLALHLALLRDALGRTEALRVPRFLFLGDAAAAEIGRFRQGWSRWLGGVDVLPQSGQCLGERLRRACRLLSGRHRRLVVIGIDSPTIPLLWLSEAFDALRHAPTTIGPTSDGGYYLIGMNDARPELFQGIDWGTSRVLRQTLRRISAGACHLLPPWYDVDRPEDLTRLAADPGCPPATARTLAKLRVRSAKFEAGNARLPG